MRHQSRSLWKGNLNIIRQNLSSLFNQAEIVGAGRSSFSCLPLDFVSVMETSGDFLSSVLKTEEVSHWQILGNVTGGTECFINEKIFSLRVVCV